MKIKLNGELHSHARPISSGMIASSIDIMLYLSLRAHLDWGGMEGE